MSNRKLQALFVAMLTLLLPSAAVADNVAKVGDVAYETLREAIQTAADASTNVVVDLTADAVLDITAWDGAKNKLSIGKDNTETITINGNGHTLIFDHKNSDWNNVATMNDAKTVLTLNNMSITNSGYNDGPWNRHDINFNCAVVLNSVTSDKALAFKNSATLKDVTITETGSVYAIWISPRTEGQKVDIDGLSVKAERGIKVDDQYVDNATDLSLDIRNSAFETTKKAAILVKSSAKVAITASNLDITKVAADNENAVWVDEDKATDYGNVTLTSSDVTMAPEGGTSAYEATIIADGQPSGYYKTLAAAIAAAQASETVSINKAGTYTLPNLSNNITVKGEVEGVVFNHTSASNIASIPNGATFQNVKFTVGNVDYHGFQQAGTINMENCIIDGKLFSYGDMNFTGCQFTQSNSDYHMWCYAGDLTYTNCTFTNSVTSKFLNIYNEGNGAHKVTANSCKFVNNGSSSKAALNVKATAGSNLLDYDVKIENCTTEGDFPAASSSALLVVLNNLVQVDDRPSTGTDKIVVTQDGEVIYKNGVQTLAACEYVAQTGEQKYETLQAAFDAAEAEDMENIVIDLLADATIDITARANVLSIGTENTKSITINGNDHALTFNQKNSDWNDVSTANDAVTKLTLKDMAITSSGYNNGPWNRHDINFSCAVELNNVTSDKALAFKNSATLRNVTVNDNSGDIYAIWISPRVEGQTIDIDGLNVTCSRGIKVDDQYVSNDGEVQDITLNIANATFETTKKSAILVKSAAKTTITASNLDITNAKADNVNAVWVDEANAKRYGDVTLNGEGVTMIPEGGEAAYQASLVAGNKIEGYYKVFTEAVAAATDENVITLHADIADAYTLDSGKTLKINKNGKTINVVAPEGCLLNESTEGDVTTYTATLLSDSDIVLTDGEAYTYTADTEVKSATFVRKFPESVANIYLSWFVPFDYTITAEDANKFEFYKINMIANAPNPGVSEESDKVWIYINKMEVGDVLRGNMPYLFKPLEAIADGYEFKADNAVLKAKNEGVLISTETMLNKYSFYGTYDKITLSPNDAELGLYMGNKGSLSFPETQSINVGAYRWIIRVSSKNGIAYVRELHFVDDSESTGVRNVAGEGVAEAFYTLDGVKVEAPAKGIYVMKCNDGTTKKVLFK